MSQLGPIVVVDPFSSGLHLAEAIVALGEPCVGVRSLFDERHAVAPSVGQLFTEFIEHKDLETTADRLRKLGPRAVIAGCEPAVELTDALAEALGLRGNSSRRSAARRNKYLMHAAIQESGLTGIKQIRTADLDEATKWAAFRNSWPVVVKPLESAGTDGVHICQNIESVAAAFENIVGRPNIYGALNREILVQEYLDGTEYVVDAVLRDGTMLVAAIWRYCKQQTSTGAPIYRYIETVPLTGELQDHLVEYSRRVTEALEIRNGPVHVEIMWLSARNEPVLVEVAARMHGGLGAVVPKLVYGTNQVELTIDAFTEGRQFKSNLVRPSIQHGHLVEVFLISGSEGKVCGYPVHNLLSKLQSYVSHNLWIRDDLVRVTRDLWTSPGVVILQHTDRSALERDIEEIARLEANNELFELGEKSLRATEF
ncbi:ATP-grasp domain-containing protein [Acidovorax sp.]|jgi:biotin carboxylase|uniref:ATP-grasp domain-containing protein n=1 Tax=Acidovorax sp. TaxID=1872122 RepID=UPI0027B891A0|nr:ATP-grasp domain-containing protein [Acidovorax sp.]